jgi:hypothetical protein
MSEIRLYKTYGLEKIESNRLPLTDLVAELNAEFRATYYHAQSAVIHSLRMGELLVEAKKRIPHGEWYSWLAENFEGTPRHAQNFMRLYRERDKLDAKRVAHFSLRGALKELQELNAPKDEPTVELDKPKAKWTGETKPITPKDKPYYKMTPGEREQFEAYKDSLPKPYRLEDYVEYDRELYGDSVEQAAAFWRERCIVRLIDVESALERHKECRPRYRKATPDVIKAERTWERKKRRLRKVWRYWNRQFIEAEKIARPVDLVVASPREAGYLLHWLTGDESIKSLQTLKDEGVLRIQGGIVDEDERREARAALRKARERAAKNRPAKPREWR